MMLMLILSLTIYILSCILVFVNIPLRGHIFQDKDPSLILISFFLIEIRLYFVDNLGLQLILRQLLLHCGALDNIFDSLVEDLELVDWLNSIVRINNGEIEDIAKKGQRREHLS